MASGARVRTAIVWPSIFSAPATLGSRDTINAVRSGSISVQAASNISRLASLALKGIEVGELDKKMDLVNSVINDRKMKAKK